MHGLVSLQKNTLLDPPVFLASSHYCYFFSVVTAANQSASYPEAMDAVQFLRLTEFMSLCCPVMKWQRVQSETFTYTQLQALSEASSDECLLDVFLLLLH